MLTEQCGRNDSGERHHSISNWSSQHLSLDDTHVTLISANGRMVRDTSITMPLALHRTPKKIAEDRATTMNILVNTAAHWLAGKDLVRLG